MQNEFSVGDMKLGVATSPTQIEGGSKQNSWYYWYTLDKIKDSSDPYVACEHAHRVEEDAKLAAELGIRYMRMGIEWAKVEPERGRFDDAAMERYIAEIRLLKELGIEVLLTLHHFTNPIWFEKMGAFENPECDEIFDAYVRYVVKKAGGLVSEYITLNEPNMYVIRGYAVGDWPPGVRKRRRARAVMSNMAACHIVAYNAIHEEREKLGFTDTRVGISNHLSIFEPKYKSSFFSRAACRRIERFFQGAPTQAFYRGVFMPPLKKPSGVIGGKIKTGMYSDFIGVSYLTRAALSGYRSGAREDAPVSDQGTEIYPEGLARICKAMRRFRLPVYVTANGVADRSDSFRSRFIYEHLKALAESEAKVDRYYYWTLYDDFEWLDGITARFGLFETDFGSQERHIRKSGRFYADIIKNNGVTEDMYRTYVEGEEYPVNPEHDE